MPVYNRQLTRLNFNRNFQVGSSIWNAYEDYTSNVLATRLWIRELNGQFVDFSEFGFLFSVDDTKYGSIEMKGAITAQQQ